LTQLENVEKRVHHAVGNHADAAGRGEREIGNPPRHEWPAIVDADVDRLAVGQVRDPDDRAELQRLVSRGQPVPADRRALTSPADGRLSVRELEPLDKIAVQLDAAGQWFASLSSHEPTMSDQNSGCSRKPSDS